MVREVNHLVTFQNLFGGPQKTSNNEISNRLLRHYSRLLNLLFGPRIETYIQPSCLDTSLLFSCEYHNSYRISDLNIACNR